MSTVKPVSIKKKLMPIRVTPSQFTDVLADAKHFRKSKDGIVQAALQHLFCFKREERAKLYAAIPNKIFGRPLAMLLILCAFSSAHGYTAGQLADAIRKEEGNNPNWLYGINHKGNVPLPEALARARCLATIAHAQRDFKGGDFIGFLSTRYCPANSNSWSHNVKIILYGQKN